MDGLMLVPAVCESRLQGDGRLEMDCLDEREILWIDGPGMGRQDGRARFALAGGLPDGALPADELLARRIIVFLGARLAHPDALSLLPEALDWRGLSCGGRKCFRV